MKIPLTGDPIKDAPCKQNGWPKYRIGKPICRTCDDVSCYKYNSVDRTPKNIKRLCKYSKPKECKHKSFGMCLKFTESIRSMSSCGIMKPHINKEKITIDPNQTTLGDF